MSHLFGDSSNKIYKDYGCYECKHSKFYYDISESMGNEFQRDCLNPKQNYNWEDKCPFKEVGKPDWSEYNEPKYDPDIGGWR